MGKFQRIVRMYPAWDKGKATPDVQSAELAFYLKGAKGTIQFVIATGWRLPHMVEKAGGIFSPVRAPYPSDLGYHSPVPRYEGQPRGVDSCEWLNGEPCYYDGSSLNARPVFDILVSQGHEAMWTRLAEEYVTRLGKGAKSGD